MLHFFCFYLVMTQYLDIINYYSFFIFHFQPSPRLLNIQQHSVYPFQIFQKKLAWEKPVIFSFDPLKSTLFKEIRHYQWVAGMLSTILCSCSHNIYRFLLLFAHPQIQHSLTSRLRSESSVYLKNSGTEALSSCFLLITLISLLLLFHDFSKC